MQEYLRESIIDDKRRTDAVIDRIRKDSKALDVEISTREAMTLIPQDELKIKAIKAYKHQTNEMAKFKNKYNVELKSFD